MATHCISDIRLNRQTTALSSLNQKQNLIICSNEARIIITMSHFGISVAKESIEISNKGKNAIPDNLSYNIPELWLKCLKTAEGVLSRELTC